MHAIRIRPGLRLRYLRSKAAEEKSAEFVHLKAEGKFDRISVLKPPMGVHFSSTNTCLEFESRRDIEKDIVVALKQNETSIIGICGVGGVGKTTIAKRIARRVSEENSFEVVVMAVISQKPEIRQIQQEIAEQLGLKLGEQNLLIRAERLRTRLMGIKTLLILLDDVWEMLNLEELGIPFQSTRTGCKLILTSRSRNTLTLIEDAKIFSLDVLSDEEAWILLIKYAGNSIDSSDMHQIAKDVAKECKGLPLALVTVGSALRGQTKSSWENALLVLQQSIQTSIPEVLKDVYLALLHDSSNCHSLVKRKRDEAEENQIFVDEAEENQNTFHANICNSRTIKFRKSSNNLINNVDSSNNNMVLIEAEENQRAGFMINRESAQISRQRKKHCVEELEDKVKNIGSTIQELKAQIAYISHENAWLRQPLGGGMVPPAPMAPPPLPPPPPPPPPPPFVVLYPELMYPQVIYPRMSCGGLPPKCVVNVRCRVVREAFTGGSVYARDQFYEKHRGRVLAVDGNVTRTNYGDKYSGGVFVNDKNHGRGRAGGEPTMEHGMDEFAHVGNGSEPLAATVCLPRYDNLAGIVGNFIIYSVLVSEKATASPDDPATKAGGETRLVVQGDLGPIVSVSGGRPPHLHTNPSQRRRALRSASVKDRLMFPAADGRLQ